MLQNKTGLWIAGIAAAVVLVSIGYGMGRRAGASVSDASHALTPAGAPLPPIQIEPIQPQEELAAISSAPANPVRAAKETKVNPTTTPSSTPTNPSLATASAEASMEESARVREIQRALQLAGFNPGPIDGHLGQRTRVAVRDFQRAQGLEPDGKVGAKTWSKLEPYLKKQATGD